MNRQVSDRTESPDPNIPISSQLQDHIDNIAGNETLKNVKVYIPAEGYDSSLSFEQNLSEGRIKLFSEMPVSEFDSKIDPLLEYLPPSETHDQFFTENQNGNQNYSEISALNASNISEGIIDASVKDSSSEANDFFQQKYLSQKSGKKHPCDVCNESFNRRRDLALHYLTHSEKEKNRAAKTLKKCELCAKDPKNCECTSTLEGIYPGFCDIPKNYNPSFPEANTVLVKTDSASGSSNLTKRELYSCPECEQIFGLQTQLKQHAVSHRRERARKEKEQNRICCNSCNKKFPDNSSLVHHVSTDHPEKLHLVSSSSCQKESWTFFLNDLQPQVCSSCHTIFNNLDSLQKHLKRLGWVCNICNTYFCLKSDFNSHYVNHMASNSQTNVSSESMNFDNLWLIENNTSNSQESYSCNKCSKKFKFRFLINQHDIRHTKEKNISCNWCKKKFKQVGSACLHYFTHKKDKNNICKICNKKFLLKESLNLHHKRHL